MSTRKNPTSALAWSKNKGSYLEMLSTCIKKRHCEAPLPTQVNYCKPAVTLCCRNISDRVLKRFWISVSLFCRSWKDLKDFKPHKFQIGYFLFTFIKKISQIWHIWCRCCLSLKRSLFWKLYKDTHMRTVSEEVYVAFKRRQRYIQLTCRIIQTKTSQMKPFPLLMHSCLENIYFHFAYIVLPSHETPFLCKRRRSPAVL